VETMLRPYQNEAIAAIRKEHAVGNNRQLLCMATGTGKTICFSSLPEETKDILPGQTLLLLHRDELAKQALDKFHKINPNLNIQQEAGEHVADPSIADVVIASVQTLGRKGTKRLDKFNFQNFSRYIVDEAHRSVTDSYMNVYNAANLLGANDKRLLLGVTATPTRGDGTGLNSVYQTISYTYSLRQAIDDGWLVDIKGIRVDTKTSLDEVSTKGGDFDPLELALTVNTQPRNQLVAKAYLDTCHGRQAIGFGVDIAHSQALAAVFQHYGINAEAVWGVDPDRADKIQRFRDGKIDVLFNAQLLTEGFDLDSIACVINAAPTKSPVVFSQRIGRGTRLKEGKTDTIILDIVDSTLRHSLVTVTSLLGLPKDLDLKGKSLIKSLNDVEKMQLEFPTVDFSTLKDLDKIEAFIEAVNLWEVKFLPEVQEHSAFTWYPSITGGYSLTLGENDSIKIEQNLLDFWELRGKIKGKTYKGERASLAEAFSAADKLVQNVAGDSLTLVKREAPWHNLPATKGQLWRIRRIHKGKKIPLTLTRGMAAKIIGAAKAGKG
jgi:ATP-dependent helicase IRC3